MASIKFKTYMAKGSAASELYITATPMAKASLQDHVHEIFSGIREILHSKKARIFQERIFATQDAFETTSKIRAKIYDDIDDGVGPSFLVSKKAASEEMAGVQVHAVISENVPEVIEDGQKKIGRVMNLPGRTYLSLSCITAPEFEQGSDQAWSVLKEGEFLIKKFGGDFFSVPRTWMWIDDILSWYEQFNQIRNNFFAKCGILDDNTQPSMPASTGIGLAPANGCKIAMDLTAVIEPAGTIKYAPVTEKQQSAYDYGSAFSRASEAITPAGKTVFISGTASIDADGNTTNIDDAHAQITTTIENVQIALKDMNCSDDDVVQIMAYCKTAEVKKIFDDIKDKFDWPWVTIICDICRDDLLFEIEATAVPQRKEA